MPTSRKRGRRRERNFMRSEFEGVGDGRDDGEKGDALEAHLVHLTAATGGAGGGFVVVLLLLAHHDGVEVGVGVVDADVPDAAASALLVETMEVDAQIEAVVGREAEVVLAADVG